MCIVYKFCRWGLVSYKWECTPYAFQLKPHGNSKSRLPYSPLKRSERSKIQDLSLVYQPHEVVEHMKQDATIPEVQYSRKKELLKMNE